MSVTFAECNSHCIKIRYSIEPRERRHVKGYGVLSFARNIGTHATKVAKNISNKYGHNKNALWVRCFTLTNFAPHLFLLRWLKLNLVLLLDQLRLA